VTELRVRVGYNERRTASIADLTERLVATIRAATSLTPVLELAPESALLASSRSGIKLPRVVKE
jgi:hypothetical protein